ncbi:argininosuccinate lyase [Xylariales sp. AK1849]|nr:argininosuccinate lyase [Xylariales sp. AK1849]
MNRDRFFWLGQINKASAVVNIDEGLLDRAVGQRIARGLTKVLDDGNGPGGIRAGRVIDFEPLLIKAAGIEATRLHIGRSSQDMHTTASTAMIRDETLRLAKSLHDTTLQMVHMAREHVDTLVPNYTNGVAAQPNSYGHYLLGHVAGLLRDAERLQQFFVRLDRSAMGTTVLNGSSWPLNRDRMAACLGFSATTDNAYDAVQITSNEMPVELGALCTSIMLHAGGYIQDIMVQYAQPRPWILLKEGGDNTYVSSAMPQKRNPGLLNNARANASKIVTLGVGRTLQAHNITPGMIDARNTSDNIAVLEGARSVLRDWGRILDALQISPQRALEELNSDWTASQEVADVLMRCHDAPFRIGHHFVSNIVTYARSNDIRPSSFPYTEAQRIWTMTHEEMSILDTGDLPMSEEEFRETLDPAAIIRNRATAGGPQPVEMERMLKDSKRKLKKFREWFQARREFISTTQSRLEADFKQLIEA